MIRKAIIVVLTLGAVGIAGLAVATYFEPWVWGGNAESGPYILLPQLPRGLTLHSGTIEYHHWRFTEVDPPPQPRGPDWHAAGFAFSSKVHLRGFGIKDSLGNDLPGKDLLSIVPADYVYRSENWAIVLFQNLRIQAPLWPLGAVLAAYPTIAFIRGPLRRWRRRRKGLCVSCGYNLTGNVTGVCPECGERA